MAREVAREVVSGVTREVAMEVARHVVMEVVRGVAREYINGFKVDVKTKDQLEMFIEWNMMSNATHYYKPMHNLPNICHEIKLHAISG